LVYLNIYGTYYQFFIIILLIAISLSSFVGSSEIPIEYMKSSSLLEDDYNTENCKEKKN
jgi:hypothetical protein